MEATAENPRRLPAAPTISVLIPNYNHAPFLKRALQALADQTMPPFEIVLVDDCSTDDSLEMAESFVDRLPQLRIVRRAENGGVNATVNTALALARGDFIVSSSADDWLEPTFIAEMLAALAMSPDIRLCVSRYVEHIEAEDRFVVHDAESELGQWFLPHGPTFFPKTEFAAMLDQGFVWLPINGAVIHRETFLGIGGYDDTLRWHSDWFATYAIAFRHGFAAVPAAVANFRVAAGTYSSGIRQPALQRDVCRAIFRKMRSPGFDDIGRQIHRRPAAIAPFIHHMLTGLASTPAAWPFVLKMSLWWVNQARKGRRPGFLRDWTRARGIRTTPRR